MVCGFFHSVFHLDCIFHGSQSVQISKSIRDDQAVCARRWPDFFLFQKQETLWRLDRTI